MILGIDLGTSSVKVQIIDERENIHTYRGKYSDKKIGCFYSGIKEALKEAEKEFDLKKIEAIGLSSQSCSYILYNGTEDSPFYSWNDPGGSEYVEKAKELFSAEEFIKYISMPCPRMNSYPIPRILWFQEERKNEWKRMKILLQPKDYLYYQLTGMFASDKFLWRGLSNIEKSVFDTDMLNRLGMERDRLPELYSSFEAPGSLKRSTALELGLKEKTPVYLGCNDYFASLIGMGITGPGQNFDITGTSEHVGTILSHISWQEELISGPYINGNVLYGVTGNSGRSIQWAFKNFGNPGELVPEEMIEKDPAVYLPYLDGERAPIWNTRASGAFLGLHSSHSDRELLYSVMEGVAFSLYHIFNTMKERGEGEIKTAGGAAVNFQFNRMKAALFGKPLFILKEKDTSALGAILCALTGSGKYKNLGEAAKYLVKTESVVEPEERLKEILLPRYEKYIEYGKLLAVTWK